jgi:hypothetical protein
MSLEQKEPVIEPMDNVQMPESPAPMQEDATALIPSATAPMPTPKEEEDEIKPVNESIIPDKKRKRRRSKKNSKCKSKKAMAKMRNCKCICKSKRRAKKSLYEMYSNDGKSQF